MFIFFGGGGWGLGIRYFLRGVVYPTLGTAVIEIGDTNRNTDIGKVSNPIEYDE